MAKLFSELKRLAQKDEETVRRIAARDSQRNETRAARILVRMLDKQVARDDDVEFRTMKNGKKYPINGETGEILEGPLKGVNVGEKGKSSQPEKSESSKSGSSGIVYADEKISGYMENPKSLGETTHREKYDDFIKHGVEVLPLSSGDHIGKPYEQGGGYKVNASKDGGLLMYHPEEGSHHDGEYYKLSSGKYHIRRFKMNGDPAPEGTKSWQRRK